MSLKALQPRPLNVSGPPAGLVDEKRHHVPFRKQERPNWCWAACVDMVLEHFKRPEVLQCQIANRFLKAKQVDCCDEGACDKSCDVTDIRTIFNQWELDCKQKGRLSPALLRMAVKAGPVEVGIQWNGGKKHVVIVHGFYQDDRGDRWLVNDPWIGPKDISYISLRRASRMGSWNWTWCEIVRM